VAEVWRTHEDGAIPTARYVDPDFAQLEREHLWNRVRQIAGREEQIADPGDVFEYEIGLVSILIVRGEDGELAAMRNACRHRGTKLAVGRTSVDGCLRCPYHGWEYGLDGALVTVVDREDFGAALPEGLRLGPVRLETFGGFVFVNLDPEAMPLRQFLGPLCNLLAPYRLEDMRLRLARTTVLPANWKTVIDAFNEGYHVQALHRQILPWIDDTSIAYEQFEYHARYGRLPGARRLLQPSAQDVFWFPNFVGPIYPGSAIAFRVRPNGDDVHTALNDTWVLEWPDGSATPREPRYELVEDWDAFEWDPVTRQDYDNLALVQDGMASGANELAFTNPRQEGNVAHMHRVIDRFLFDD